MDEPFVQNLNLTAICKDCKEVPPNLVEEFSSGDLVCGSCGLVIGDRIVDTRSEWRTFANDDQGTDDPSRVGDAANPLLNGSQLSTSIAFGENKLGRDLHRAHGKVNADKATKSLLAAYKEIGAHCDSVNMSKNVSDTAKHLYKRVDDAKAFKGKSLDVIISGCIFIACRQCKVPRTFREVFAMTKVSKKEIGRIFKALEKFFAEDSAKNQVANKAEGHIAPPDTYKVTTATEASELIVRFNSQIGLRENRFTIVAQALAKKVADHGDLGGRSPLSIAASSIFMTSYLLNNPRTPKEISAVAGVSDSTIRNAYKQMHAERETLIEASWFKDGVIPWDLLPAA
ncbi:transcription initiation factor-like protein iib [Bisporella sp. PMI_857]|nr:transcription initiation factor-like protein iib [Bisporella sp. PMI_857]